MNLLRFITKNPHNFLLFIFIYNALMLFYVVTYGYDKIEIIIACDALLSGTGFFIFWMRKKTK